jgi:hypothetical protein
MPTPKTPDPKSVREEPEEAGASGGAPAEGELPQEMELVSIDQYGEREVKRIWNLTYGFALKEAAKEIYYDIAYEILEDVLEDLPKPHIWANIYDLKAEKAYRVETRKKHIVEVLTIPKHRAVYYFGGMEILGVGIYIPIEALYIRRTGITYYHIVRSPIAIETIREDLEQLMKGESSG